MRVSRRLLATGLLLSVAAIPVVPATAGEAPAATEPDEGRHAAGHDFHRNHFGGLMGISTHLDTDETALTMGLDYVRQFTRHWAAAVYVEMISSDLERDVILAIGGVYYPIPRLGFILAPGIERARKTVEEHGEAGFEDELEPLLRFGAGYGFGLTPNASVGPAVTADWAGERWTILISVALVTGF
jgi:hypothetical protein